MRGKKRKKKIGGHQKKREKQRPEKTARGQRENCPRKKPADCRKKYFGFAVRATEAATPVGQERLSGRGPSLSIRRSSQTETGLTTAERVQRGGEAWEVEGGRAAAGRVQRRQLGCQRGGQAWGVASGWGTVCEAEKLWARLKAAGQLGNVFREADKLGEGG